MPQIDNLTFFNQALSSGILFFCFAFYLYLYLLPQYVVKFFTLKILWSFINTFLTKIKLYSILSLVHRIILDNKINQYFIIFFKLSLITIFNAAKFLKNFSKKKAILSLIGVKGYLFLNKTPNLTSINGSFAYIKIN